MTIGACRSARSCAALLFWSSACARAAGTAARVVASRAIAMATFEPRSTMTGARRRRHHDVLDGGGRAGRRDEGAALDVRLDQRGDDLRAAVVQRVRTLHLHHLDAAQPGEDSDAV